MMHSSLIKQIKITTVVLKSPYKTAHGPAICIRSMILLDVMLIISFLTGRAFHNILLFAVQRVGRYPLLESKPPTSLYNSRRLGAR